VKRFTEFMVAKAGMGRAQFETLARGLSAKTFSKGELLLRPGGIGREIFFVEEGLLRQYSVDAKGREHILHFAPENWLMSDRGGAHFNVPSEYFIDAVEKSEVICMDGDFFGKASSASSSFRVFNEKALHNHIRHLQRRIAQLLGASAQERYLEFIRIYPGLAQRVPQWMIASYLGITPEGLSRVRKSLSRSGSRTGPGSGSRRS
jgi:CRP/FNR family transcriptional regulator, anaerobic regulatory protein